MNIKDADPKNPTNLSERDRLEIIFETQREHLKKYLTIERELGLGLLQRHNTRLGNLDDPVLQYVLKDMASRVTTEIVEAMECLKNKPWKTTHMTTDVPHFKEELADALHFFIELCILAGIDAEELFLLYLRKTEVNHFRQRSRY